MGRFLFPSGTADENADVEALLPVGSPHILGEVLVASEGGAAVLWTVARGFVLSLIVHSSGDTRNNLN